MLLSDFTYNGITFARLVRASGYRAEFVNGDQVGIRDTITALPGVDGVERYKSFYRDRLIEVRGFVIGSSEEDLYDNINALEAAFDIHNLEESINGTDGFLPLEFTDPGQNASRYYVKPIKNTLTIQERRTGFSRGFSVLLEAKDPRKYQTVETLTTVQPSTAQGTSVIPFTIPVVIAGDSFTGTSILNNTGDAGVFPTQIKITGACSGPKISNTTTSKFIRLTSDVVLSSTDYILISPPQGTIYKYDENDNGVNIIQYLTSESVFWSLNAGNNTITYTADAMSPGSKAEVTTRLTS